MSEYLKEPWLARFLKWLAQYLVGLTWVWQKIIAPPLRFIYRIGKWFFDRYMWIWSKVVYTKEKRFSRMRAGLMIVFTVIAIYLIPTGLFFAYQTTMFLTTQQYEVIYLTNAEEVNPDEDTYSVRGCEALPCTEENSVYFRVRPTAFHQVYSAISRGYLFYPDRVASVVAPGVNECKVYSYGIRVKTLMRRGDWYPDLLDAVCMPLGNKAESQ